MKRRVERITIENFRGISHLELTDFARINIFIGKNGVGKSTVLEAIYLNTTWGGRDLLRRHPIKTILFRRGLNPYIRKQLGEEDPMVYVSYFFREPNEPITISSNITTSELKLWNSPTLDRYVSEETEQRFVIMANYGGPVVEIEPVEYGEYTRYVLKWPRYYSPSRKRSILLDDNTFRTPYYGTSSISEIIIKLEEVSSVDVEDLKAFLEKILRSPIKKVSRKVAEIVLLTENEEKVPMSLLGDGIKTAMGYYYALNTEKPIIVLLEEPENHLHPGLMKIVAEEIAKTESQVFITTHSLEFLEYLLDSCSKLSSDSDVKVFRFKSIENGVPDVEVYSGSEANVAINSIGVDLR
ncbi:AAA family ATPase [Thermococcus sp.]|uniref:AAA family ATPase n=1 Tax=Thermococcus sp. TaxID=35749 RepID=UPI002637295C|nr:AAA family ATPase [Thermococcus sp.]